MRSKGQNAYAQHIGVSRQRVNRLVRTGKLKLTKPKPKPKSQATPHSEATQTEQWHTERIAAQTRSPERRVKDYYDAKMAKLEFERAIGEMIERNAVAQLLERVYANFKMRLLASGAKLAPLLFGQATIPAIKTVLDREHAELLTELSQLKIENL